LAAKHTHPAVGPKSDFYTEIWLNHAGLKLLGTAFRHSSYFIIASAHCNKQHKPKKYELMFTSKKFRQLFKNLCNKYRQYANLFHAMLPLCGIPYISGEVIGSIV
jgi:hypothetical protein